MSENEIAELWTVLRLEGSGFTKGILSAEAQAEESSTKIGQSWQKLAKMGQASAVIVVAAAAASVKMAMAFDQQMAMVHTQAGASNAEVKALSGQVLALAGQVGIGPTKLAEGLYHVESAGFRGAAAMAILTSASKLAAIGQSDLETTTQAVVGVMASQIKGVKDASDAGALLNTTVGIGDMRMQALAQAIGTGILPKAAAVGLSFEDVGGALATLTDNVTPANEAATRLGMTFSMMAAPTDKAKAAYESIGMTSVQMANDMRTKGLAGALEDLKKHLDATYPPSKALKLSLQEQKSELGAYSQSLKDAGVPLAQQKDMLAAYSVQLNKSGSAAVKQSEAMSAMFGGGKSSGTMLTLLGELPRLQDKMTAYGTATSRAAQLQDAWKTQQGQFSQQLKELGANAQALGIKVGNYLIPPLQKAIGWLASHQTVLKTFAIILGTVMVAAIGAWTASVIANTAAMLANPTTWIILAIVAAIGLLIVGIFELVKHWGTVWKWMKGIVADVWNWMKSAWSATAGFFVSIWKSVAGFFVGLWHDIWDKGIKAAALAVWNWLVGAWHATINALAAAAIWVKTKVIDPVVGFFETFFVRPIELYLKFMETFWIDVFKVIRGIVEFFAGFFGVIIGDIVGKIRQILVPVLTWLEGKWRAVWKVIAAAALTAWNQVLKPTLNMIERVWKATWSAVTVAANWAVGAVRTAINALQTAWTATWNVIKSVALGAWNNVIKPVMGFINTYGVQPVKKAIGALETAWDKSWAAIKTAASGAWNLLKTVWGYVQRDGIDKLLAALGIFKKGWDTIWNGVKSGISAVWNWIKPILDKIGGAISKIVGGIKSIASAPGKAGSALAHLIGFDQGGWVPGNAGAPLLAVVHGGEFVVSRDMLAGRQATPIRVGGSGGSVSSGASDTILIQTGDTYLDGKKIQQGQTTRYQRTKKRNGQSFAA